MTTPTSWRRGGLAVLLLALVVAGCSAQAAPTPTPHPTSPLSPSESPSQQPSSSPSAPPSIPAVTWEPGTVPAAPGGSAITSMVATADGRLVAIGFDGGFGTVLWTSDDGRTWTDVTPTEFASYGLVSLARLGDRLVAVGRGDTINVEANVAAVLLSDDGLNWRPADTRILGQLIDVMVTDDGLLAVGGVPMGDSAGIWRSSDGESWERLGPDFEHAFLWSIVEGGPGLVAAGWRRNPEPDLAVWTSTDGAEWTLAPDPEGSASFEAHDLVALPGGTLVMTGSAFDGSGGRIWTSPDGVAWELADADFEGGAARTLIDAPAGLVALGFRDMSAVAWVSTDAGRTWAQLGRPIPDAYLSGGFLSDDGVLHLLGGTQEGTLETGITGRAMVWSAPFD